MNLKQLRDRCKFRFRDLPNVLTPDAKWNDHLNIAQLQFLSSADFPMELALTSVNVAANTGSVDLPTDIFRVLWATDTTNAMPLTAINSPHTLASLFPDLTETGDALYFRVFGSKLSVYARPDSAISVQVGYYKSPDPMVADTDVPVLPVRYHEALVIGACRMAYMDDREFDSADRYLRDWQEYIQEAVNEFAMPVQGEYVPLPRTSRNFYG